MNRAVPAGPRACTHQKERGNPALLCKCCAELWESAEFCGWAGPAVLEGAESQHGQKAERKILHTHTKERHPTPSWLAGIPALQRFTVRKFHKNTIYSIVLCCRQLFPGLGPAPYPGWNSRVAAALQTRSCGIIPALPQVISRTPPLSSAIVPQPFPGTTR